MTPPLSNHRVGSFQRDAHDEITVLQTLLDDVYRDAGDGRTLIRELVQNADDAKAKRLIFLLLETGWPEATNPLLRGPALVALNDGPFTHEDQGGIRKAVGGAKGVDSEKIGRFGVGLKSVFHVCEAFLYLGADNRALHGGVLNPWCGTGEDPEKDPINPHWNDFSSDTERCFKDLADQLLNGFDNGLLLWIPLRQKGHLNRGQDNSLYGLRDKTMGCEDVEPWFKQGTASPLLITQCGYVHSFEYHHGTVRGNIRRISVIERNGERWLGRYTNDDEPVGKEPFQGDIGNGSLQWKVCSVEALGHEALKQIREDQEWPKENHWVEGRRELMPTKALAHAAISVIRSSCPNQQGKLSVRGAVYLPLDDNQAGGNNNLVETHDLSPGMKDWELLLHGYFLPSQDRRSIPGVTDDGQEDNTMRSKWNHTLLNKLLLPLLPKSLEQVLGDGVPEEEARAVMQAITGSRIGKCYSELLSNNNGQLKDLLPIVTAAGVSWKAGCTHHLSVLAIPKWREAPAETRADLAATIEKGQTQDIVFIDGDAPRFGSEKSEWQKHQIKTVLDHVPMEVLQDVNALQWLEGFLRYVIKPGGNEEDIYTIVAHWLCERIGEGALRPTREGVATPERDDLRKQWVHVFQRLPASWLVRAPLKTQRSVEELAKKDVFGSGLMPVPLGSNRDIDARTRPEQERLKQALLVLGRLIHENANTNVETVDAHLALSEALLAFSEVDSFDESLCRLPLVRARRYPGGDYEALSVAEMRDYKNNHRIFAGRKGEDDADDGVQPIDILPRESVKELAACIDEPVWVVGAFVRRVADIYSITAQSLAEALLTKDKLVACVETRKALLQRFTNQIGGNDSAIREAVRALICGRRLSPGNATPLYCIQNGGPDEKCTLALLLKLLEKPWCAVNASLVNTILPDVVQDLGIQTNAPVFLQDLLQECINYEVDWLSLADDNILHLIQNLHNPNSIARWRQMPLHKREDGSRGIISDNTLRVGNFPMPPSLEHDIVLLAPDDTVAHLYADVPELTRDTILGLLLAKATLQQCTTQILDLIVPDGDGDVVLPDDNNLRDSLRAKPWIKLDNGDCGVAPDKIIALGNEELCALLKPLEVANALGDHHRIENVDASIRGRVEQALVAILGPQSPLQKVQRIGHAIDTTQICNVCDGAYLLGLASFEINNQRIVWAMQSNLINEHKGWKLVAAAATALNLAGHHAFEEASQDKKNTIVQIANKLRGDLPGERQMEILDCLAQNRPGRDRPEGRLHQHYVNVFHDSPEFIQHVLPHIKLPTSDGNWHDAKTIARSATGVARHHLLLSDYHKVFFNGQTAHNTGVVPLAGQEGTLIGEDNRGKLEQYFEPWQDRLQTRKDAIGAFLALLGNVGHIKDIAEEYLGPGNSVDSVRAALLDNNAKVSIDGIRVYVEHAVVQNNRITTCNLLGASVAMDVDDNNLSIFAIDPVCERSAKGDFWCITLRDITLDDYDPHSLIGFLGHAAEWWAANMLGIASASVTAWWSKYGTGSQLQIDPARASIIANLPHTLRQINVNEKRGLKDALQEAERVQRLREQATPSEINSVSRKERQALHNLANMIQDNQEIQKFVWRRIQEAMRQYGYSEDCVLLELIQNADDALAQSAEIDDRRLHPEVCKITVRMDNVNNALEFTHYGRPINETGGGAFPHGIDRDWDQDLYFMLSMNLSGKPGESPNGNTQSATTGRFGLGFKSVHLVSERPSVASGLIAFDIVGGLLPVKTDQQPVLPEPVHHHLATKIVLPLCNRVSPDVLFRRFESATPFFPAVARHIHQISVEGRDAQQNSVFEGQCIVGAPGWQVANNTFTLPGHAGEWRLLRYRPQDAGIDCGSSTVVIGILNGRPAPLPASISFLWNVVPTSEGWGCGYIVNGPFKLDPGRTHVALENPQTIDVVDRLGEALGDGLIKLYDALHGDEGHNVNGLPSQQEASDFLAALWRVLTEGLDTADENRKQFLLKLHGNGSGASKWARSCSVVPSGLPAPFARVLPNLDAGIAVSVVGNGLENAELCAFLNSVDDLKQVVQRHQVISDGEAKRLKPFMDGDLTRLEPIELLRQLFKLWNYELTPERLHTLRPLNERSLWTLIVNVNVQYDWFWNIKAKSQEGGYESLRKLLLPADLPEQNVESDIRDECLRSAFAPDSYVLDNQYITCDMDIGIFRRLRVRHEISAADMTRWYQEMCPEKQEHALRYLVKGREKESLLQKIIASMPAWLNDYDKISEDLWKITDDSRQQKALLAYLFPARFPIDLCEQPPVFDESSSVEFFTKFANWWTQDDKREEVIRDYEKKAWPGWLREKGLSSALKDNSDEHWLALLVLGACRSMGRKQEGHHRALLEFLHDIGCWQVFMDPENPMQWMESLKQWQDRGVQSMEYLQGMSLFAIIFQLSRHLDKYRNLLLTAGMRPQAQYSIDTLLAPLADPALTGAGQNFDAPPAPLNIGLHWVLRELVRLDVISGEHLCPDCWVPSKRILDFLYGLGMTHMDENAPNPEKARAISNFLAEKLGKNTPHLHFAFDVPLLYVESDHDLQEQLGISQG